MMEISGLKFVMLASNDVDRSVAFYRDQLNLPLTRRFEDFAFFDCERVTLVLSGQLAKRAPGNTTSTEVVFGVASVKAAFDELRASGVAFINEPRAVNDLAWAVNLSDPDGHLLSLYGNP
jgi:predicted enzyme related to lactoylglutathione lyase